MFLKNTIPASWIDLNKVVKPSDVCSQPFDLPYGVAVIIHDFEACFSKHTFQSKPVISVKDCTLNSEAFILSFTVENFLPFKVPKHVEFAKFLSKDINALQHVKMDRAAAIL